MFISKGPYEYGNSKWVLNLKMNYGMYIQYIQYVHGDMSQQIELFITL